MEIEFDCGFELDQIIRNAAKKLEVGEGFDPQIRQADERFGDFQANGDISYKAKRQNPRDLAQNLIDSLPKSDFWETSIAGPGFINFKSRRSIFINGSRNIRTRIALHHLLGLKTLKKLLLISHLLTLQSKCMLDISDQQLSANDRSTS